jgi:hypothetical protein
MPITHLLSSIFISAISRRSPALDGDAEGFEEPATVSAERCSSKAVSGCVRRSCRQPAISDENRRCG